ncbi:Hypothetical Protein FCC1311_102432 [Hondaea fermentalgiana]|uniref:DAAF9 N-terminal domain-containing protein n=1 Tax=Hondaea fermentalgiana TaxID=2315210 RepID=A0A2R5GT55_9STRA|nr:Hypothetical Protein FCC1311_102432 [Hondaea fermentalgiana]|eukprot:GBG34020.1 Hypothetical Protein FCC1311_102432 [Hondaea fermentalgiana]
MASRWDAHASAQRVQLVQEIVKEFAAQDGEANIAMLVVPGMDGRYNTNAQRLLKYLLLGASGETLLEPTIDASDEALEDCFFVIGVDNTQVFYNTNAAAKVAPLVGLWPNVKEYHLLPGEDKGDSARAERYKISALVNMLRDYRIVIMPTQSEQEDNHEMWPLVQAYGLDEFGTGGFLSAVHQIAFAGPALLSLWSHLDAHALAASRQIPRSLLKHWTASTRLMAKQVRETGQVALHEAFEPLVGFYEFGSIRCPDTCTKSASAQGALVHKLTHASGVAFLVRGQDAASGIRFARTFFVDAQQSRGTLCLVTKMRVLTQVYMALAMRLHERPNSDATCSILGDLSRSRAIRRLTNLATKLAAEFAAALHVDIADHPIRVDLQSFDLAGQDVVTGLVIGADTFVRALHYLEVSMEIPGSESADALCLGDTFVMANDPASPAEVLTDAMDRFLAWSTEPQNMDALALQIENLGAPLKGRRRTPCELAFAQASIRQAGPVLQGHIQFFTNGLIYEHAAFGSMVLNVTAAPRQITQWAQSPPTCAMASIEVVKADGAAQSPMENLTLNAFLGVDASALGLLVFEQSELSDALHTWREKLNMLTFAMEDLESASEVAHSFTGSRMHNFLLEETTKQHKEMELIDEEKEEKSLKSARAPVIVVTGPPGGGKEAFATILSQQVDGILVENDPFVFGNSFEPARFRKMVAKAEKTRASNDMRPLVLITPGDTSPSMLLETGVVEARENIISAVAVISARYSYADARKTNLLPGVQAQISSSDLVHSVVLTGTSLVSEAESDRLQTRLRLWNPRAELFCIDGPCVPRGANVSVPNALWDHLNAQLSGGRRSEVPIRIQSSSSKHHHHHYHHEIDAAVVLSKNARLDRDALRDLLGRLTAQEDTEKLAGARHEKEKNVENERPNNNTASAKIDGKGGHLSARIMAVTGHVCFDPPSEEIWALCAVGGHVYFSAMGPDAKVSGSSQYKVGLLFEGMGLGSSTKALESFVAATSAKPRPLLTSRDIEPEALTAIEASLAAEPLPVGTWFDGRSYMNSMGKILKHHPCYEERVDDLLATRNAPIREANHRLQRLGPSEFASF